MMSLSRRVVPCLVYLFPMFLVSVGGYSAVDIDIGLQTGRTFSISS